MRVPRPPASNPSLLLLATRHPSALPPSSVCGPPHPDRRRRRTRAHLSAHAQLASRIGTAVAMLPLAFWGPPAPVASNRRAAAARSPVAPTTTTTTTSLRSLLAPPRHSVSGQQQHLTGSQLRGAAVVARAAAVEFLGDVSPEDAAKFERIAASLVAKMGQVPNYDGEREAGMLAAS